MNILPPLSTDLLLTLAGVGVAALALLLAVLWLPRLRHRAFLSVMLLLIGLAGLVMPLVAPLARRTTEPVTPFISVSGAEFLKNGKPIRFVGANTNHIWEPAQFSAESVLQDAEAAGINLVRIFPYAEQFYPFDRSPAEMQEVERYWTNLDRVLDLAARRNIRVILAPTWDYVGLILFRDAKRANEGHYRFMTESTARDRYKQFWAYLAQRKNTVNGIVYSDDPTILGYNVINEWEVSDHPKGNDSQEARYDMAIWFEEIAETIKRVAPNQLVGSGLIGDRQPGVDFLLLNGLPSIDFATVHAYQEQRPPDWLIGQAQLAHQVLGKPILLEEGMTRGTDAAKAAYIRAYWEVAFNAGYNGVLLWDWQTSNDGYQVMPSDRLTIQAVKTFAERFAANPATPSNPKPSN